MCQCTDSLLRRLRHTVGPETNPKRPAGAPPTRHSAVWSAKIPRIRVLGECRRLAHPGAFSGNQEGLEGATGRLQEDNRAQAAPSAGGAPVSQTTILPPHHPVHYPQTLRSAPACSVFQKSSWGQNRPTACPRGAYLLVGEAIDEHHKQVNYIECQM